MQHEYRGSIVFGAVPLRYLVSQSYIGQTGRTLSCCIKEHKQAVSQGDSNALALAEHVLNTGHQIDWSNAMVLDSSHFYYQRLYLEWSLTHLRVVFIPVLLFLS